MIDANTMAAARLASAEANYARKIAPHPARAPAPIAKTTTSDETTPTPAPSVPTNEQLDEYERSAELRHEFTNFSDFAAFRCAEALGAFRLLRRHRVGS